MFLIEILLPAEHDDEHETIRALLTEKFGGVTAFTRTPAEGRWKTGAAVERDEIIILEIMAETIDETWWKYFRRKLEQKLGEKEIVIRYHKITRL
jgi:hypothetical protein